jgi:hypothetical protein
MFLKQRVEEVLSENYSETKLLRALQQLILEYDCDHDFFSGSLDIPPDGFISATSKVPHAVAS